MNKLMTLVFVVFAVVSSAVAEWPDAPTPKPLPKVAITPVKVEKRPSMFHSTNTKIAIVASVTARTVDTIDTCRKLNSGTYHEAWLPVQSCAGVAAWNAGTVGSGFLGQLTFRKMGLSKYESVPHWASAGGSVVALLANVLSKRHPRQR